MKMVVGIGQTFRGDDGIGPYIVEKLQSLVSSPDLKLIDLQEDLTSLIDLWEGVQYVIAIDAISSNLPPGTIHFYSTAEDELPTNWIQTSTHGPGLSEVLALGTAVGKIPPPFYIFGIEGNNFSMGKEMAPEVKKSCQQVISFILQILKLPFHEVKNARKQFNF